MGFRKGSIAAAAAVVLVLASPVRASEPFGIQGVSVVDDRFDPQDVPLAGADRVEWTNQGSNTHTVTADDGSFDSGVLTPGDAFAWDVAATGSIAYHCSIHGGPGGTGMSGVLLVASAGAADVSAAGGRPADPPDRLASTGLTDVPASGLILFAVAIIALGAYLRRVERIVYPERF